MEVLKAGERVRGARLDLAKRAMATGETVVNRGGCEKCSAVPVGGLLRCGRCEKVKYCSLRCQRAHWQAHRGACVRKPKPTGGAFVDMRTRETDAPKAGGADAMFRNLRVPAPDSERVAGACYLCAILLKRTPGDEGNSGDPDAMGVFWVKRPLPVGRGPADSLLSRTVFSYPDAGAHVGACLTCARALAGPAAKARVEACFRYLAVAPFAAGDWSPMDRRRRAAVLLHPDPKRTSLADAAGVGSRGDRAGAAIPFGDRHAEAGAFEQLGMTERNCWRSSDGDARAYALLRLYSADGRWRDDADYVAFSAHRCAAAGDAQFSRFCEASLPRAVRASDLPGEPARDVVFLKYDERAPLRRPAAEDPEWPGFGEVD